MGGGGNSLTPPKKSLEELLQDALDKEEQQNFIRDVNAYMQSTLADINNRDNEKIKQHLDTLASAIDKEIEGTVSLLFGGSISKNTYANGLSDVDVLVKVNNTSLMKANPREVLEYFKSRIEDRLPRSKVKIGALALTVVFSDGHEIQLLPSVATKSGFKIPKPNKNEWSSIIHPDKFAGKLTDINKKNAGKVVPVIKMFKRVNEKLDQSIQLSGYHIESLAINAFKDYSGEKKYHTMLSHLCKYSSNAVLNPIKDSTGQSVHVDGYLGDVGSNLRKKTSKGLELISKKMGLADQQRSLESWIKLIN